MRMAMDERRMGHILRLEVEVEDSLICAFLQIFDVNARSELLYMSMQSPSRGIEEYIYMHCGLPKWILIFPVVFYEPLVHGLTARDGGPVACFS
jgi:hypothetical protein